MTFKARSNSPSLPPVPLAVSQGNIFTASLSGVMGIGGMLAALARVPHMASALVAICFVYGFGAIFVSMPFNPLLIPDARLRRPGQLTARERRILFAFYAPQNRRRACWYVLLAGAVAEVTYVGMRVILAPQVDPSDSGVTPLLYGCVASSVTIMWVGLYGLTTRMRRDWEAVVSYGPEWPIDVGYPGPRWDALKAVLSNRNPRWLK